MDPSPWQDLQNRNNYFCLSWFLLRQPHWLPYNNISDRQSKTRQSFQGILIILKCLKHAPAFSGSACVFLYRYNFWKGLSQHLSSSNGYFSCAGKMPFFQLLWKYTIAKKIRASKEENTIGSLEYAQINERKNNRRKEEMGRGNKRGEWEGRRRQARSSIGITEPVFTNIEQSTEIFAISQQSNALESVPIRALVFWNLTMLIQDFGLKGSRRLKILEYLVIQLNGYSCRSTRFDHLTGCIY